VKHVGLPGDDVPPSTVEPLVGKMGQLATRFGPDDDEAVEVTLA